MKKIDFIALKPDLMQQLTSEQAWHYRIIPKEQVNGTFSFYIDKKTNRATIIDELELLFNKNVHLEPVASELINESLGKYYRRSSYDKKRRNVRRALAKVRPMLSFN